MSKRKAETPQKERNTADYYKLNTKAVEELANTTAENTPSYSEKELAQYKSGGKFKLPDTLKALFIKFWFNGAVCFFFFWGLAIYISGTLEIMLILGLGMGMVTDLLVNNLFRFIAKTPGAYDKWMMFPEKSIGSFFLNILYAFVVLFFVYTLYNAINVIAIRLGADPEKVILGVEPILFGIFYLLFDLLFLGMKRLGKRIVGDAERAVRSGKR